MKVYSSYFILFQQESNSFAIGSLLETPGAAKHSANLWARATAYSAHGMSWGTGIVPQRSEPFLQTGGNAAFFLLVNIAYISGKNEYSYIYLHLRLCLCLFVLIYIHMCTLI